MANAAFQHPSWLDFNRDPDRSMKMKEDLCGEKHVYSSENAEKASEVCFTRSEMGMRLWHICHL